MNLVSRQRRRLPVLESRILPARIFLSNNEKTGISVNLPIALTCEPTKLCASYCYAGIGRLAMDRSLDRQVDNFLLLQEAENWTPEQCKVVANDLLRQVGKADFLRWNGSGDLLPGTVRIIKALTRIAPGLIQWVISRKELANELPDHPAIRLLLTLDASTPEKKAARLREIARTFKRAKVRLAYVRVSNEDIPPKDVDIIFNKHVMSGRRLFLPKDPRTCEATTPGVSHKGACNECRRCFANDENCF